MKWLSFFVQSLVVGLICKEIRTRYLLVELDVPENATVEVARPEKTRALSKVSNYLIPKLLCSLKESNKVI